MSERKEKVKDKLTKIRTMAEDKIEARSERYYDIVVPIQEKFIEENGHELTQEYGESLLPNNCSKLAALGFAQDIMLLESGRTSGFNRAVYNKHLKEWYIVGILSAEGMLGILLGQEKVLVSTVKEYKSQPENEGIYEKGFPYIILPELERQMNAALGWEDTYEKQAEVTNAMSKNMEENTEAFNAEADVNYIKAQVEELIKEWNKSEGCRGGE